MNIEQIIETVENSPMMAFGIRYQASWCKVNVGDALRNSVHPAEWLREIGIEAECDQQLSGTCAFRICSDLPNTIKIAIAYAERIAGMDEGAQIVLVGGTEFGNDEIPENDQNGCTIRSAQVLAIF